MTGELTKEWCINMAKLEDGAEVGAGFESMGEAVEILRLATEIERLTENETKMTVEALQKHYLWKQAEATITRLSARIAVLEGLMDAAVTVWAGGIWTGAPADMTRVMVAQSKALEAREALNTREDG